VASRTGAPLAWYLRGDTAAQRTLNFLSAFREVRALALAVTATNVAGVAYGVYFYWDQLLATPWYLLPFVPDSPTGPFLMVIIYGLWWFEGKTRSAALELLAFVALVKYGIWTVVMFWLYRDAFFAPERAALTNTLLVLHIAEALQAGVLLKGMKRPRVLTAALIAGWLALGDFCDYALGTHPRLPQGMDPALAAAVVPSVTVSLTIICFLAALGLARPGSHPPREHLDRDDVDPREEEGGPPIPIIPPPFP
jgi:uncharacterized membrane protein YpjA